MWKNFIAFKLPDKDPTMEVVIGLCKTSPVWAALKRSPWCSDLWIIRQTARIVTSPVYGAGANADKFHSHASVSAKMLVTRSLANPAIRAVEAGCAGGRSQARRGAVSARPSWDAREGRAHNSQTGNNGKTSPAYGCGSLYSCLSKTCPKTPEQIAKKSSKRITHKKKHSAKHWEFLKPLQKV